MPTIRWLITGASGQLGGHVLKRVRAARPPAEVCALTRRPATLPGDTTARALDLADLAALARLLDEVRPTHVLHLGAVTAVGDAHADPHRATRVNTQATQAIAEWTARAGGRMIFASTDMVFNGENAPYEEDDAPSPLSHYGCTKASAEQATAGLPGVLIVRLPLMYGFPAVARATTFVRQIAALRAGEPLTLFTDEFRTPISVIDAARAMVALAESDLAGIIHVAGPERLSRYDMAARFAAALGIERPALVAVSRKSIAAAEPRPADLSLDGERFNGLFPDLAPHPISRAGLGEAIDSV